MNKTIFTMGFWALLLGAAACTDSDASDQFTQTSPQPAWSKGDPTETRATSDVENDAPNLRNLEIVAPRLPPDRFLDGVANNIEHPRWGAVGEPFLRLVSFAYADGVNAPAGPARPNARLISNRIFRQTGSIPSPQGLNDLAGVWALFVSHDLQAFRAAEPRDPFGIPTPPDDDVFPPGSVIPLDRWIQDVSTGRRRHNPRRQINNSTSFLDGSVVYGIDPTRSAAIRTFVAGELKTSDGNLLPLNTFGLPNRVPGPNFFLAGDERANTTTALAALQTLFMREHNRLAAEIAATQPSLQDDEIFQRARRLVAAQMQAITYNEFLPALLGPYAPRGRVEYDPNVNATLSELFSVVGYRFGHSTLSPEALLAYADGRMVRIPQRTTFFNPEILKSDGLDPVLRGLALQRMQDIDTKIIDDVRNQTIRFNEKIDLFAYDVQSGREFGVPDYNRVRKELGLGKVRRFSDITSDHKVQQALAAVYGTVNDLDPLVAGLAEDHLPGAALGPLFTTILIEQFERTRRGDRFWYESDPALSEEQVLWLRSNTLADVIRRNTSITDLGPNAFYAP